MAKRKKNERMFPEDENGRTRRTQENGRDRAVPDTVSGKAEEKRQNSRGDEAVRSAFASVLAGNEGPKDQSLGRAIRDGAAQGDPNPGDPVRLDRERAWNERDAGPEPNGMPQQETENPEGAVPDPRTVGRFGPIGAEQVHRAQELLRRYKQGKQNLDQRIVENEQWWKMRHWDTIRGGDEEKKIPHPEPASAWLFNSIANKHADAMDNYPCPNVLARAQDDEKAAQLLSEVLPCVLETNDYEQVYSDAWWRKLKAGTSVKGVFWDSQKLGGLGDVTVRSIDILNLFWEPGICCLEDSRNLFHVEMQDDEEIKARYGISGGGIPDYLTAKYLYDDTVDETGKSAVVDWYYKKQAGGRCVLHYCKFVGDQVLYASENDERYRERGFYDHGRYPFVLNTLFPVEGTPSGFGYIDVMKDTQLYIDKLGQNIMENSLLCTRKRYWVKNSCDVNMDEFLDFTNPVVHTEMSPDEDNIREMTFQPLSDVYVSVLNNKIDELKETSGNRDFVQGGTTSGVTAASAIAALQESGSKLSRDMIKGEYRAYREECYLIIELMRQFYTEERLFRITGENGDARYVSFDNSAIRPAVSEEYGVLAERIPVFDIMVTAQKNTPYNRLAQNELAKEFFGMGFFRPDMADQALSCMKMMEFTGKEAVMKRIGENGTLYQQVMMLQQQLAMLTGGMAGAGGPAAGAQPPGMISASRGIGGEHPTVQNARERAGEAASPG